MNLTPLALIVILAVSAVPAEELLSTYSANDNVLANVNLADKTVVPMTNDDLDQVDNQVVESSKGQVQDDDHNPFNKDQEEDVVDESELVELYDRTSDDGSENKDSTLQQHSQVLTTIYSNVLMIHR